MSVQGLGIVCITVFAVVAVVCFSWLKYIEYKTKELRAKYPIDTSNVPYTQRNVWKKDSTRRTC